MKTKCIGILLCYFLGANGNMWAQQYFRLLEALDKPYEQKIARFTNGDILIGGSPLVGVTADQNGGINLARLDKCGSVRWSINYQWKHNYMKLKDVIINELDNIFLYGSAYEGSDEFIFLLKLNKKGKVLAFRVFHGGTVDNFTYNIELQHNRILAYGLLLDWNTPKRGFLAIFDEDLNLQNGRVFEPFESTGKAIITNDNGFLCRSGLYLVKLDAQANLQWATTFETEADTGLYPVAGPLAVQDGYIFEALYGSYAFFYKINENGKLLWKSKQFPSTNQAADLTLLTDGNILVAYNCPGEEKNYPCQLRLSPNGEVLHQQILRTDAILNTGAIYQSIDKNNTINMIGSRTVPNANSNLPSGFLLQYSLDSLFGKCFQWEIFKSTDNTLKNIQFAPLSISFFNFNFKNVEANITPTPIHYIFEEGCNAAINDTIRLDTLLKCGENWVVVLPGADFEWEDEEIAPSRRLEHVGIYRASNHDCITPLTYEYNLQREPCQCKVYLPTAFSPNNDGQNDRLELFSNCKLQLMTLSIYNRWGNQVFTSNAIDASWDGIFNQKPVESGLYIAVVRYQLLNETNEMEEGSLIQNLQIIR